MPFYGLGIDSAQDGETNFRLNRAYMLGAAELRLADWFRLRLNGGLDDYTQKAGIGPTPSIEERFTPATAPLLGESSLYLRGELSATAYWLASPGYSRTGGLYRFGYEEFNPLRQGGDTFGFARTEVVQHIPILRETWVLSFRGRAESIVRESDLVPYFLMPTLGGGDTLRGYTTGRFRDRHTMLLNGELRWFPNRLGLDMALFYDAGNVATRLADLRFKGMKTDLGFGVRFHTLAATALRLDLAKGKRAARLPSGAYRALASRGADAPLGGFRYDGTRPDDPNDIVPHEHRRELRALKVFGALANLVDMKNGNTLDALVVDGDRTLVRHYLQDVGSTFGTGALGPREWDEGYEYLYEGDAAWKRLVTFGGYLRNWQTIPYEDHRSIGRFEGLRFDPVNWKPRVPTSAIRNARPDDTFWAARRVMALTGELIRAMVQVAEYSDPAAAQHLANVLMARRDRIGEAYLPAINPIVDVALDPDGVLTFANAAVEAGVAEAPAQGYRGRLVLVRQQHSDVHAARRAHCGRSRPHVHAVGFARRRRRVRAGRSLRGRPAT